MRMNQVCLLLSLVGLFSCKTSRQLREDGYVDPSGVKTLDSAPGQESSVASSGPESLQRQLVVAQGELENMRMQSQQESLALRAQISKLEAENQSLRDRLTQIANIQNAQAAAVQEEQGADLLWKNGTASLQAAKFAEAYNSFSSIVQSYPKDSKVYGALIAAGMSQYNLKNYKEAALLFNQAIDKFSNRKGGVAIAWYFQGLSFSAMGQHEDAKLFYEELNAKYPKSYAAKLGKKLMTQAKPQVPSDIFKHFPNWTEFVGT